MCLVEIIGYLACTLVFATFYMTAMMPLRLVAIASNVAFIAYGYLGGLTPILLLHVGLLPLNGWRLCQTLRLPRRPAYLVTCTCSSLRFLRRRQLPRRPACDPRPPARPSAPDGIRAEFGNAAVVARWV
jgi:hypothetical protein